MRTPLFLPASFFLARTPVLPIEEFYTLLEKNGDDPALSAALFNRFKSDPVVREGLAVASTSLYTAVKSQKFNPDVASSLFKYFSRLTSRSTPFGLFSFVTLGKIEEATSVSFDLSKISKRARPDMEWLFAVIDNLCADPELFPKLALRANCLSYESGGRVFLSYIRKGKAEEENKTVSIRSSFLVHSILTIAKTPVTLDSLLEQILLQHPSLNQEKVTGVIKQLLQQQFMLITLLPSLLTDSPFDDLLNKLSSISFSSESLAGVVKALDVYQQTRIGEGEEHLESTQKALEEVATASHYIQVDSAYEGSAISLSTSLANELAEAAEILWKLSPHSTSHSLKTYHTLFLDKYGSSRIVPLMELLNEESGLGIPDIYLKSKSEGTTTSQNTEWKKWLQNQWQKCVRERKGEIEITEKLVDSYGEKADKTKALLSFDLFCQIIADSPADLDAGRYLLQISSHSLQAGATFGRFLDLFGDSGKQLVKDLYLQEENLEKENLFAQSSFLSFLPRNANVAIHENLRRHAIDLSCSGQGSISLDDIYVGATSNRFYLTTQDRTKELIVTSGNMLTPYVSPNPLRFIRDVSTFRYDLLYPFSWNDLEVHCYFPRVRYKKTILSPARWKVDRLSLGLNVKDPIPKIETEFKKWAKEWEVPRYVFAGESDQQILLDLEHPTCLKEVVHQLKLGHQVTLVEKIGLSQGQWVHSQKGSSQTGTHLTEFVIPFVKNPVYSSHSTLSSFPAFHSPAINSRWKIPGSEWLFVKCYGSRENEARFLIEHCEPFANFLLQQKIISDWFFIRYLDPKPHIRLRFRGTPQNLLQKVMPALYDWAGDLLDKQRIQDLAIGSYEREIERYGGEELISHAESVFHADSVMVLQHLRARANKKVTLPEEIVAPLTIIDLLKGFGLSLQQQKDFFAEMKLDKAELKGFREHRAQLLTLASELFQSDEEIKSPEFSLMLTISEGRKDALKTFTRQMDEVKTANKWLIPVQIQSSILHMHCNRLMGTDNKKELKAYLYAYQTLIALDAKMKGHNINSEA